MARITTLNYFVDKKEEMWYNLNIMANPTKAKGSKMERWLLCPRKIVSSIYLSDGLQSDIKTSILRVSWRGRKEKDGS